MLFLYYMKNNIAGILFTCVLALQLHNVLYYPETRSFDATAHIEYITFIQNYRSLPLPATGWELFQAPLYYVLTSFLPTIKTVQFFGLFLWIVLVAVIFNFLKLQSEKKVNENKFWLLILLSTTPILIYLTPAIGNEFFSGVVISIFLVTYYSVKKNRLAFDRRHKLLIGILLGATLLSKATALFLVVAFLITELIQNKITQQFFKNILIPTVTAVSIGGWFYIRSYLLYGNPIYQPADYVPLPSFAQPIFNRDIRFFFSPESLISLDIFKAHHYSFLGGTLFSWFFDVHTIMVPVQEFSKAGVALVLTSIPFFILFLKGVIHKKNISKESMIFYVYSLLLLTSYVLYNFKLPIYSTVKASFIVSLFIPFSFFFLKGFSTLSDKQIQLFKLYVIIFSLLVIKNFWIKDFWYQH